MIGQACREVTMIKIGWFNKTLIAVLQQYI